MVETHPAQWVTLYNITKKEAVAVICLSIEEKLAVALHFSDRFRSLIVHTHM